MSRSMSRSIALRIRQACLFVIGLTVLVGAQEHDERTIVYRGPGGTWSGSVYIAAFGDSMPRNTRFQLLRPPVGQDLCDSVTIDNPLSPALNFTAQFLDYDSPIGLLIPRGRGVCSEEVQTKMALEIQKRVPALRFLVIHGADSYVGSTAVTMNILGTDYGSYSGLGVMYMPYSEYVQIDRYMNEQSIEQWPASANLLDPTSEDWQFLVQVSGRIIVRTDAERQTEAEVFYWLRLVLFIVLIVTPCFRACYLWYAGGGRLHWRRDDNGRITGILYVPPMPTYWMWMQRNPQQARETVSQKLSEAQFETLPVITYQRNKKYMEDPSESGAGMEDNEQDLEMGEHIVATTPQKSKEEAQPMDIEMQRTEDTDDMNLLPSLGSLSDRSEDESPPASPQAALAPQDSHGFCTTCTMCSICIDDFEAGEELVLLPRCKHAFHKECIHPWLLERQGCCPLCKVRVLDDGSEDDSTEENRLEVSDTPPDAAAPTRREDTQPDEEVATAPRSDPIESAPGAEPTTDSDTRVEGVPEVVPTPTAEPTTDSERRDEDIPEVVP